MTDGYSQLEGAYQPQTKWPRGQEPAGLQSFGARLRKTRLSRGLTQVELGAKIGATGHTILRLEAGHTKPTRRRACELAGALGVDVVWLVHGSRD